MDTIPYWTSNFPHPDDLLLAGQLPQQVDVAVVGSGYTGLSAALELAKSGATVAVLERETTGWGASSRNSDPHLYLKGNKSCQQTPPPTYPPYGHT